MAVGDAIPVAGQPETPQRSCAACRARRAKGELLRFVGRAGDGAAFDPGQQARGRGGYCCRNEVCVERALRRGGLARTLRTLIGPEQVGRLAAEAVEYLKERDSAGASEPAASGQFHGRTES